MVTVPLKMVGLERMSDYNDIQFISIHSLLQCLICRIAQEEWILTVLLPTREKSGSVSFQRCMILSAYSLAACDYAITSATCSWVWT